MVAGSYTTLHITSLEKRQTDRKRKGEKRRRESVIEKERRKAKREIYRDPIVGIELGGMILHNILYPKHTQL